MSIEQKFSEWMLQNGGSFDYSAFFNRNVTEFAGRYIAPAGSESGPNNHYIHFLNFVEHMSRRIDGTFKGYVHKADDDDDLEFSVEPFTHVHRGLVYAYAGGNNIAGLVAGATRYVWANLLPDKTVTIEVGAALPTSPHVLILAAIAAPAAGPWRPQHLSRLIDRHSASANNGLVWSVETPFTYLSAGVIPIATVRAGARIHRITTLVETSFNGTTPQIRIGDAGDDDRLVVVGFVNLGVVEKYLAQPFYKYAAETAVFATLAIGGAPTQGVGTIILEHS